MLTGICSALMRPRMVANWRFPEEIGGQRLKQHSQPECRCRTSGRRGSSHQRSGVRRRRSTGDCFQQHRNEVNPLLPKVSLSHPPASVAGWQPCVDSGLIPTIRARTQRPPCAEPGTRSRRFAHPPRRPVLLPAGRRPAVRMASFASIRPRPARAPPVRSPLWLPVGAASPSGSTPRSSGRLRITRARGTPTTKTTAASTTNVSWKPRLATIAASIERREVSEAVAGGDDAHWPGRASDEPAHECHRKRAGAREALTQRHHDRRGVIDGRFSPARRSAATPI